MSLQLHEINTVLLLLYNICHKSFALGRPQQILTLPFLIPIGGIVVRPFCHSDIPLSLLYKYSYRWRPSKWTIIYGFENSELVRVCLWQSANLSSEAPMI